MPTPPAPTTDSESLSGKQRPILLDIAFLRLWSGATASGLATWALPFVLGLAVLDRTLTATDLGLLLAARTAGFLAAVPVAGVLADRHSRRGVVLWAGLAAGVAAPVIAAGLGRSVLLMAVAAAVAGAGQGACRPAFQALTAEVVDPERRQQANAAMTLAVRVNTLVGPSLAALLAVFLDIRALLLGIGLLWLVAALVPGPGARAGTGAKDAPSVERPGWVAFLTEFADGIREARRHPWFLAGLGALTAVIATGYSATGVALPLVSRDEYGTEVVLAGAMTAYTAGALAAALLIARWRPRSAGWTALTGLAAYGFAPLSLMFPVHPIVVMAAYAVAGIGIELFNVPWFTATQREVAPDKLARVSSLDFLLSYGLAPVGLALIAPAIDAFGTQAVLAVCALTCFAAPAVAALVPSARHFSRRPEGAPGAERKTESAT
ncbi:MULTISPECIES: MFS transporter [Streptomyces]|uniref:MFS transporter n=1 Tax=Streptomyces thermoviolaceus subsp. thermoviolaceus TaxID=66860 RepID=A0ABX0YU78_STRTL|nr:MULTISPECIES: MFS transporter [Streptomyces]WTD46766.1 MFS transporter [Streptomyces thermoviolaceus]NJP15663.1 MFS transporter [Streptomyces thermoviolaceus subsp. thermoviolaceus]RSR96322.1 MFS transporter [Streptomyces sp. WAC00469]GGV83623.1 MFS transporter [Streptomyces thermoviolaceus subsp. apingens]GHA95837.1 MFS transporter [Streptomyces thermoviolaceus subsp. thermoviolaceus]